MSNHRLHIMKIKSSRLYGRVRFFIRQKCPYSEVRLELENSISLSKVKTDRFRQGYRETKSRIRKTKRTQASLNSNKRTINLWPLLLTNKTVAEIFQRKMTNCQGVKCKHEQKKRSSFFDDASLDIFHNLDYL